MTNKWLIKGTFLVFLHATALSAKRVLAIVIQSVCPSVCHNPVSIHRLAAYHKKHCFERPSRFQAATHISRVNISALNVDFSSASFDPLGSRSPLYECIELGYPLQNAGFLLLSSNLAREQLQIDTDLLRIITSTADELSAGTNIDDLERPWTPKIRFLWFIRDFSLQHTFGG